MFPDLQTDLYDLDSVENDLRHSAKESLDAYDVLTQIERMFDRSGKLDERNSSDAQIRTLLQEQKQMIIAEYREKVGHHELQAAHAEEKRRLLKAQ